MTKIRVMIIDDSVLMRHMLGDFIANDPDMTVVASLGNAAVALTLINDVLPDIITLDIEMPGMDGLTALTEIRKSHPHLPVIMCSSLVQKGVAATLDALMRGANDYIVKPTVVDPASRQETWRLMREELLYKIKELTTKKVPRPPAPLASTAPRTTPTLNKHFSSPKILAIGTSTGGPNALSVVLPQIPADFPVPIVVVQHMPPVFTNLLAESLSKKCKVLIEEARDGAPLRPGVVFIAPGNYHMTIEYQNNQHVIRLNQDALENYCRPAVDVLFRSVAKQFGSNILAVIMTGMGQDGLIGCKEINKHDGQIIIQDEASSTVWGMPGAVSRAGLAQQTCPLGEIASAILQRIIVKKRA